MAWRKGCVYVVDGCQHQSFTKNSVKDFRKDCKDGVNSHRKRITIQVYLGPYARSSMTYFLGCRRVLEVTGLLMIRC
jgi:hypothetical protein